MPFYFLCIYANQFLSKSVVGIYYYLVIHGQLLANANDVVQKNICAQSFLKDCCLKLRFQKNNSNKQGNIYWQENYFNFKFSKKELQ